MNTKLTKIICGNCKFIYFLYTKNLFYTKKNIKEGRFRDLVCPYCSILISSINTKFYDFILVVNI